MDLYLHSPIYIFMVWYLIKHRDSFTFVTCAESMNNRHFKQSPFIHYKENFSGRLENWSSCQDKHFRDHIQGLLLHLLIFVGMSRILSAVCNVSVVCNKNTVLELALVWFLWLMVLHQVCCWLPMPISSYKYKWMNEWTNIIWSSQVMKLSKILLFWYLIILKAFKCLLPILVQYQFVCCHRCIIIKLEIYFTISWQ